MFIKLTDTLNGKISPILINLDNVIAIEDHRIYAKERVFCVNETLEEMTEMIRRYEEGDK